MTDITGVIGSGSAEVRASLAPVDRQTTITHEEEARLLFRYVTGDEWQEYRAVMTCFAGTFFSELTPEEVTSRLVDLGAPLDASTVAERLESLRRWGNLTVSSATGTPSSLADYYRRRNRYLITRAGQEVHDAIEGVLTRVDEVRDISTGRLRSLLEALRALAGVDAAAADPQRLADLVRAVFDPHQTFTSEITQFFAAINQWQSRYDLTTEEFSFFADVLVSYVSERLDEIERASRPIAMALDAVAGRIPLVVERANRGLAERVEAAGLDATVTVARTPGSSQSDWDHLADWFVARGNRPARMDQLRHDAVVAIRSLTINLIRLSRVGVGGSSRRGDFLRLARCIHDTVDLQPARLVAAAFGMYAANHFGTAAADAADPVSIATSWWDAPPAVVPVSLRERGDTASRGGASPIPDRSTAQRALRHRRAQELAATRRVDAELLAQDSIDGSSLSTAALARLEQLVSRTLSQMPVTERRFERTDGQLSCLLERASGQTAVSSPEGILTIFDLWVTLRPATTDPPTNDPPTNDPPTNDPPTNDPPTNDLPTNDHWALGTVAPTQ